MRERRPRCFVIAGPNGSGKTTFASGFLEREAGLVHFVNADLIAKGLSPLKAELARVQAGKLFLQEIERFARQRLDFAFESTLSGLVHRSRLKAIRETGYTITLIYLRLDNPALAMKRIRARVNQGGHDVPEQDVHRRFHRSWVHFERDYKSLADSWYIYNNSGENPILETRGP